MAIRPTPGRSLVAGRAIRDIVRTATLGSYGVTGFAGGPIGRLIERLGLGTPGLGVRLDDGLEVELDITVALGVPCGDTSTPFSARELRTATAGGVATIYEAKIRLMPVVSRSADTP